MWPKDFEQNSDLLWFLLWKNNFDFFASEKLWISKSENRGIGIQSGENSGLTKGSSEDDEK